MSNAKRINNRLGKSLARKTIRKINTHKTYNLTGFSSQQESTFGKMKTIKHLELGTTLAKIS
jgi:hypothetical protein